MEQKEVRIDIPEGYEIDEENSSFTCIKFRKRKTTYADVMNSLAVLPDTLFMGMEDRGKVIAITKLINTARYLNNGWKPDFTNDKEKKYSIFISEGNINVQMLHIIQTSVVYFKTRELAKEAIRILGEDIIRIALS